MATNKNNHLATAVLFGQSLDQDDFNTTATLLDEQCTYHIGTEVLKGPVPIAQSYEKNMLEGRKKLDQLEWGQSSIETKGALLFHVHFTDYLTHKGMKHTHRCEQELTFSKEGKIIKIRHIHNQQEQEQLDLYYKKVGLK